MPLKGFYVVNLKIFCSFTQSLQLFQTRSVLKTTLGLLLVPSNQATF